jgi:hypothetical protein
MAMKSSDPERQERNKVILTITPIYILNRVSNHGA